MRASAPGAATPPADGAGWSLERRLPLLILALLACVTGGFSVAAYREVRASAVSRATDRLERVARELAATSARNGQARLATLRALAANPALVDAAAPRPGEPAGGADRASTIALGAVPASADPRSARVASVLAGARLRADSSFLGWELWTLDGRRRYRGAPPADARDSLALAAARRMVTVATDSVHRSTLYAVDGAIHLWTLAPVRQGGRTIGVLAERRRLPNSARAEETVRQLTGEDVRVLVAGGRPGVLASLRGTPVAAPFTQAVAEDRATLVPGTDGTPLYVVQARVAGTPWHIVLLQSQPSVLRRPYETLRNLLAAALVLLGFGTVGAWLLGRHVARPLRRATDAAAALAAGDYAQRVPVAGAVEVARLASTFNAMAAGLGDAHAALAERNAALQRANDAKAQFLAMMSHELRTPLNAIGGYTELLELGLRGPVTSAQIEDLGRIRRNKDHLLAIITDILSFARAEAGALPLQITTVDVGELFRDAVDALGPQFAARGVRLRVEPAPAGTVLRGDREKVQQVVLNLLSNALKFTEPGGEVTLAGGVAADGVRLEVRDTGVGIAPEHLHEIFEPFVQVDGSLTRRAGGTGLGLAIVRTLTEAMGGRLTVESTHGAGSRFVATLPRATAPDAAPAPPAAERATAAAD